MPISVEIPKGMKEMLGEEELSKPEIKLLIRRGIEEKLKTLLLFKTVDKILKKSKLSEKGYKELVEEYREGLAKRHGVS